MATLVLTALGTALGGPLGGALGALAGHQLDRAVIGGGARREGPRLKELAVSTSSYGTPLPRHFGTMRAPGTIIWATDLVESRETSGGGKGRPSVTAYSYSASFAVALSSRPIRRLGRIWADGNLLRGAAGDLKAAGALRVHLGYGDQAPDPLIAADRGGACPAFRGLAYCVFEGLQLADFGNRIPALSFEIVADEGEIALVQLLEPFARHVSSERELTGLSGFSDEGGPLAGLLATIGQVYPIACDAGGEVLTIRSGDVAPDDPPVLAEPVTDPSEDAFGAAAGKRMWRQATVDAAPAALRYYDTARDHQPGVQRAQGRARAGHAAAIEFPGALSAATARSLVNAAAERASWSRETLEWRTAELDPALGPGSVVHVPGHPGSWLIDSWEWRERGIELELVRMTQTSARDDAADPGEALPAADRLVTLTELVAFELPWEGPGAPDTHQVFAAASSSGAGWKGAALYVESAGQLVPLGVSGARRSVIGRLTSGAPPSAAILLERDAALEVDLVSPNFQLAAASAQDLAGGANRALVGGEVLQFAGASRVAGARWRLRGLLRGRGGTEPAAMSGHPAGTPFVLLDGVPVALDPGVLGSRLEVNLAAIGLADAEPVIAPLINPGLTQRPLVPVHARATVAADGALLLTWVRRARGAWVWHDGVDAPLNEQAEQYLVGIGDPAAPAVGWDAFEPRLELAASTLAELSATHSGQAIWVRQVGSFDLSPPLHLITLS